MKLLNEENDILLIQSTKAENELLRDVLKASLEFDYVLWNGLEEEDVRDLIRQAEKRIEQEEIVISKQEFKYIFCIISAAAHVVDITYYKIDRPPILKLMEDLDKIFEELPPSHS